MQTERPEIGTPLKARVKSAIERLQSQRVSSFREKRVKGGEEKRAIIELVREAQGLLTTTRARIIRTEDKLYAIQTHLSFPGDTIIVSFGSQNDTLYPEAFIHIWETSRGLVYKTGKVNREWLNNVSAAIEREKGRLN